MDRLLGYRTRLLAQSDSTIVAQKGRPYDWSATPKDEAAFKASPEIRYSQHFDYAVQVWNVQVWCFREERMLGRKEKVDPADLAGRSRRQLLLGTLTHYKIFRPTLQPFALTPRP